MEGRLTAEDVDFFDSFTGEDIREPSEVGDFDFGFRRYPAIKAEGAGLIAPEGREKLYIQLALFFLDYIVSPA